MSQELLPPPSLHYVGTGDFFEVGKHFFKFFTDLGELKPQHRVLDVGCGAGRMAIPLLDYLDSRGSYEGFDIVEPAIKWCQDNITSRYPNFRFQFADIHNKHYNPHAKGEQAKPGTRAWLSKLLPARGKNASDPRAAGYRFPYPARSFDFVFLTSVFTHMLPADMENYLHEVSRVMKPGATCLITWFLLNEQSTALCDRGESTIAVPHRGEGYRVHDANDPEHIIAYEEQVVRDLYPKHGLEIMEPIRLGNWCRRYNGIPAPDYTSYQDIVMARRK